MSGSSANGRLTFGGIGSVFLVISWGLMISMVAAVLSIFGGGSGGGLTGDALAGSALIAGALLLFGSLFQGLGFLGLGSKLGGLNKVAGTLSLVMGLSLALAIVGGLMGIGILVDISAAYVFPITLGLAPLFGGLALLGSKGEATKGEGPMALAGICLAVAGGLFLAFYVMGKLGINLGSFAEILLYIWVGASVAGHAVTTVVMFGQKD